MFKPDIKSGCPLDVFDAEISRILYIVIGLFSRALGISHRSISTILHDYFSMHRLLAHSYKQMATGISVGSRHLMQLLSSVASCICSLDKESITMSSKS